MSKGIIPLFEYKITNDYEECVIDMSKMCEKGGCNMTCKAAKRTDEYHGWECEITEGACMFLNPDSKACAEKYGEGPDAAAGDGETVHECCDCPWMKKIENRDEEEIELCVCKESPAYLSETGICGECTF
mgnify:CR=1 FL=1